MVRSRALLWFALISQTYRDEDDERQHEQTSDDVGVR